LKATIALIAAYRAAAATTEEECDHGLARGCAPGPVDVIEAVRAGAGAVDGRRGMHAGLEARPLQQSRRTDERDQRQEEQAQRDTRERAGEGPDPPVVRDEGAQQRQGAGHQHGQPARRVPDDDFHDLSMRAVAPLRPSAVASRWLVRER
jgi:hypothetical protein